MKNKLTTATSIHIELEKNDGDFSFNYAKKTPGGEGELLIVVLNAKVLQLIFLKKRPPTGEGKASNSGLVSVVSNLVEKARESTLGNKISDLVSNASTLCG